jgi:predicted dehydrogenase
MNMEPVRLGIIGCGVIGRVHLGTARQSSLLQIVAVADMREQAAREVAAQFGIPAAYTDASALLDDPRVEAVVLALPAAARTSLGLHAFTKGKHVLTEKPVAMNAGEVRRLIAARGDLIAGCCSSRYRLLPSAQAVTAFIATGALGDIRAVHCRVLGAAGPPPATLPPPWRLSRAMNGGGILMNWGCYDLDYLLGIAGWVLKPRRVLAQTWPVPPQFASYVAPGSDAETHVTALVTCTNTGSDTVAVINYERAEYAAAQNEESWQIIGSRGALHLQMTPGNDKRIMYDDGSTYHAATQQSVNRQVLWCGDEDYDAVHRGVLEDFAMAVRERRPPMTSLEQALIIQALTDAIYDSAAKATVVEIA